MAKKTLAVMIGFIGLILSVPASTKEEKLPADLLTEDAHFKRCSRGQLKAYSFFHVGYAALYLQRCQQIKTIFDKSPKRLRFVYERSIPARAFREAAEKYLQINLGKQFDPWRKAIDQFNQGYRDIEDGDYYELIYDPETGLRLYFNGAQMTILRDPGIGLAYFNIWFGKEPFSESLKEALLTPENFPVGITAHP